MRRHLINILLVWLPPSRLFVIRRILLRMAGISINKNVKVCGGGWIYGDGFLSIGENSWLSPGIVIHTHKEARIVIGENCDIGHGARFVTGSHEIGSGDRRAGAGIASNIVVGRGCWIGAGSIVLGGVAIGEGCVIAAGSVVKDDVPDNTLVAGVPARVKRQLDK